MTDENAIRARVAAEMKAGEERDAQREADESRERLRQADERDRRQERVYGPVIASYRAEGLRRQTIARRLKMPIGTIRDIENRIKERKSKRFTFWLTKDDIARLPVF